jgi:hypothetical protein
MFPFSNITKAKFELTQAANAGADGIYLTIELGDVFKNIDEFKQTINLFNTFKSNDDFENWSSKQKFVPIYKFMSVKEEEQIPFKLSFILNKNKEFRIGNKIISFSDGIFYENQIDEFGNVGNEKKVIGTSSISKIPITNNSAENQTSSRVMLDANGGLFKVKEDWEQFDRVSYAVGCGAPTNKSLRYRLVHYLVIENYIAPGLLTQSDLIFKLRMSQFHNGSWVYNNTSTERLYSFNISGDYAVRFKSTGQLAGGISGGNFSRSDSNTCSTPLKGTKAYVLGYYGFVTGTNLSLYQFDVAVNGSIFHKVNGDVYEVNKSINW